MPATSLYKEGAKTSSYQKAKLGHLIFMSNVLVSPLRGNLTQSEEVLAVCELGFHERDVADRKNYIRPMNHTHTHI